MSDKGKGEREMGATKPRRFEDLVAWQKARRVTREVYLVTRRGDFARDFGLAGQMQRAAVSIMSNIAEGFERQSTAEYQRFLIIAKASCGELRSQCYVAYDSGYLDLKVFDGLIVQAEEVSRVISGLHASLGKTNPAHAPPLP